MFSVVLASIVSVYALAKGYALKDRLCLFIGLGFLVSAVIDLLHGLFAVLNLGDVSFEGYFIPQTWVAGRILMSIVMVIAVVKFGNVLKNKSRPKSLRKEIIGYTAFLTSLAGIITIISLSQPLPFLIIDFPIQRPYEIGAAALFLIAIIFFYKQKLHTRNDSFYKGFLVVLSIDVFVNLIISYSSFVFDTAFNISHLLKNVSYFIFIITLSTSAMHHYSMKEKLAKELVEMDVKKNEFISMISHELKTPLNPIMNWCALMEEESLGKLTEKQIHAAFKIRHNSEKMLKLVNDILDVNKLELGKLTFEISEFDIKDTMSDILEDYKMKYDGKCSFKLESENIMIKSDCDRIIQVIRNFINNSLDFLPSTDPKITISTKNKPKTLSISVKDNGSGISEQDLGHLFKKFYQVDTSAKRKHGGTGLGLSICKGIIEGLGGTIGVYSKKDRGTEFFIEIPKISK